MVPAVVRFCCCHHNTVQQLLVVGVLSWHPPVDAARGALLVVSLPFSFGQAAHTHAIHNAQDVFVVGPHLHSEQVPHCAGAALARSSIGNGQVPQGMEQAPLRAAFGRGRNAPAQSAMPLAVAKLTEPKPGPIGLDGAREHAANVLWGGGVFREGIHVPFLEFEAGLRSQQAFGSACWADW